MEELPDHFDVIVVGTGMPECIVAAAVARVGKTVLHLDRNGYYGGDWASFNFDQFSEWIEEKVSNQNSPADENNEIPPIVLNEGERLAPCVKTSKIISNISQRSYVREASEPTNLQVPVSDSLSSTLHDEQSTTVNGVSEQETMEVTVSEALDVSPTDLIPSSDNDGASTSETINSDVESAPVSETTTNNVESAPTNEAANVQDVTQQEWTISSFRENRRKFNFDLAPKLLFSRGSLVELLISSNIARYAEFQCINRVLTYIDSRIEQVPCSRADVFSTRNVSVVEKRMLMKLLTFCIDYEEHPNEYNGFDNRPFIEFLHSRRLTPNIEHYIMHAIAMVDDTCPTIQGLQATQKFMQSLGRYGNSPFLWTCYGSAELPQCFCRLCAVFGGTYYLKRVVEAIILKDRCNGIVSRGQRIDCQWLIMESSYAPLEFLPDHPQKLLSRAIFITDASLLPADRQQNTLLRLPPMNGLNHAVTVLEFGSKAYICPDDLYIVYMFCQSSSDSPEVDLKPAVELLFRADENEEQQNENTEDTKPNVLWCVYYNQSDTTVNLNSNVPEGLLLTSAPDVELDYEHAVREAREIFEKICPGEEFLPRAPDPEDIILENHANPGEGGKIENDVNDVEKSTCEQNHGETGGQNSDKQNEEVQQSESISENESVEH